MATNQFVPFAVGAGASVVPIATYLANTSLLANGYQVGVADEFLCNRTWRQSSIIASVIAQFINEKTDADTLDDGTTATLLTNLSNAINLNSYADDTSAVTNVMTATLSPTPTIQAGLIVAIKPAITNTGIVTFNLNGSGAFSVNTVAGPLTGGELVAGKVYQLAWISASSSWLLLNYQTSAPTVSTADYSTKIATTAFVKNLGYITSASPVFSGNPTTPTAGAGDNSNTVASTAFVKTAINNAIVGLVPTGTRMLFSQGSAPSGWTQDVSDTANNRMLRVVATTGGGSAGSHDPTYMNVVPAHTHSFSTGSESSDHTHYDTGHRHSTVVHWQEGGHGSAFPGFDGSGDKYVDQAMLSSYNAAQLTGRSAAHIHYGSTDNGSSQTVWYPRYTNIIICSKN